MGKSMSYKKNILAIIGSMVGGLIATLPWVLVYVYGNMMYSFLAVLVAMGALFGYQLFKGDINKSLPTKIVVVSLLSITIATLVVIPCLLLAHEGAGVSITNFKYLYSNSDFIKGIISDYIISVLFTLLGISGVIRSIKKQVVNDSGNIKIDLSNGNNKKDRMLIKEVLLDKGAIDSNSAYVFSDEDKINNDTLNILLTSGEVVRVDDNKYYYDSKKEVENKKQKSKTRLAYETYKKDFSTETNCINDKLNQIYCADSLEFLKTLPDNCVDIVMTSPPYNFGIDYNAHNDTNHWKQYFDKLFTIFKECIRVLKSGGRIIVNIQPMYSDYIPTHHFISKFFIDEGLIWKGEILWEKNNYNCKYCTWGSWQSPASPYLKYSWEFIEVFCKNTLKKDGNKANIDISGDEFKK